MLADVAPAPGPTISVVALGCLGLFVLGAAVTVIVVLLLRRNKA